jgi:hypothetical protein
MYLCLFTSQLVSLWNMRNGRSGVENLGFQTRQIQRACLLHPSSLEEPELSVRGGEEGRYVSAPPSYGTRINF